jgi:hypothetical protein
MTLKLKDDQESLNKTLTVNDYYQGLLDNHDSRFLKVYLYLKECSISDDFHKNKGNENQ